MIMKIKNEIRQRIEAELNTGSKERREDKCWWREIGNIKIKKQMKRRKINGTNLRNMVARIKMTKWY